MLEAFYIIVWKLEFIRGQRWCLGPLVALVLLIYRARSYLAMLKSCICVSSVTTKINDYFTSDEVPCSSSYHNHTNSCTDTAKKEHKSYLSLETGTSGWGWGKQARPYVSAAPEHFVI